MLTTHQQDTQDSALELLKKGSRLLLKGSAGVGKTYLMKSLIEEVKKFLPSYKKIYCAAPTNKAVAVLKDKVGNMGGVEFITLHSALKYRRKVDNRTGEVSFGPAYQDNDKPLKGVSLIVVDESSMIGRDIHLDLEKYADMMNVKVLYVGDHKQLNPVKEEISPVFYGKPKIYLEGEDIPDVEDGQTPVLGKGETIIYTPYPELELTEIIRQGNGNPIIDLSRNLPDIWEYRDNLTADHLGYLHSRDRQKVVDSLAEVNGSDDLKYLGYTNQDVDALNTVVRERIYGNPRKVEPGESIVFNSPYKDLYSTNQELKVEDMVEKVETFYLPYNDRGEKVTFKVYVLNPRSIEGGTTGVYVVHESEETALRSLAMITKKACGARRMSWLERDKFLSQFADIKYNHAITTHKSQGSSYKKVILNISNLSLNKDRMEKERLFYTAVTRASEKLILFSP